MEKFYTIGVDFGTLSARAVLVDIRNGEEIASLVYCYQSAVIDTYLPNSNVLLPPAFVLQDPRDYEDALFTLLRELPIKANISSDRVLGIGIVFTACTMVALDENMQPLCLQPAYTNNPHSWVKLWKHHGAQAEADAINALAYARQEPFIRRYGNKSSSEWLFAKTLEMLNKAPEIYEATSYFLEAGDWMVYLLTGNLRKSSCFAAYKAFWDKDAGYPSPEFLSELNPRLRNVVEEKLGGPNVYSLGTCAGTLCQHAVDITGLCPDTCVSTAIIDAHVSVPAVGMTDEASMLMIMGTSLCQMLVSKKGVNISGVAGVAQDGILPGYYGYETGQSAGGDIYDWFVTNMANHQFLTEIQDTNINLFDLMDRKMAGIRPGSSGLLALDWWNGNRCVLMDSELSGMVLGMTLTTRPEEIYRALVEATAFGTRKILETLRLNDIRVSSLFACGGLAQKSPEVMQIFSDVLGMEIRAASAANVSALGGAIYAAVAAGEKNHGYADIFTASRHMSTRGYVLYSPSAENHEIYDKLYREYGKLHDLFGRGGIDTMKQLVMIRNQV